MEKLLIVDDEIDIVDYLSFGFEEAGYSIEKAFDGVEAVISVIREKTIEVVLMDIRMPHLDGIEALRIIKELNPDLPVIMFTGQAGRGDMALTVKIGAYTCLAKPITVEKLLVLVKQLILEKKKGIKTL